jgi:CBS domain-containing protein
MSTTGLRQIPIVNNENRLVGIVYQSHLIAALYNQKMTSINPAGPPPIMAAVKIAGLLSVIRRLMELRDENFSSLVEKKMNVRSKLF